MSTTALTDLNYDCLLLIAKELVNFKKIDSDFGAACKDLLSLGATCSSIRSAVYSDVETFGGFRKEFFKNVKLKSNDKEKIGSLFTFLRNVNTVVETLSLPQMCVSCVSMKPGECQALRDAGRRVPGISERMDSLCEMCPILPNLQRFEIGELRTDVFGPRMPSLTRLTASRATDASSCQNISRSWPALKEVRMEQYVGWSHGLKTFLTGQNRLVAFELEDTHRPYRGAIHAWLGRPGNANRLTTLSLLGDHGPNDNTFISRVGRCRNLERLEINCRSLSAAALVSLGQLARLHYLWLDKTRRISGGDFTDFFENATFSLRSVDLRLRRYADGANAVRALISHNPDLEKVYLSASISSDVFKDINSLQRLRVFKCYGADLGRYFLDGLDPGALTHLEYVAACSERHQFDNDSMDRFKARFPSCRLEYIEPPTPFWLGD